MNMDLKPLFETQRKLDEHINKLHPVQEGEDRLGNKILALLVELGELANEVKCFKFWSDKGMSDKSVVLEEFVDNLHFVLSIGQEFFEYDKETTLPVNYELNSASVSEPWMSRNLTDHFNQLFHTIGYFADCAGECGIGERSEVGTEYIEILRGIIGLGEMLGFTWDEVVTAYYKKNEVNHARQESGY